MGSVNRINTVFLYCRDLARQRAFYESAFQLGKPVIDAKWWIEYALGHGTHFALQQGKPEQFVGANPALNTIKFSLEVTGIQEVTGQLKELGATFHYEPRAEYGFWLAEFADPEGNVLRLYEKVKKPS
jgi:predicted enzyme related to lactoylglutathione lyase